MLLFVVHQTDPQNEPRSCLEGKFHPKIFQRYWKEVHLRGRRLPPFTSKTHLLPMGRFGALVQDDPPAFSRFSHGWFEPGRRSRPRLK